MTNEYLSNGDQEIGEYDVKAGIKADNQTLRREFAQATQELRTRNQELELLTANIPGGMHQCINDPVFTLVNVSNSFLSMFGYTREEITTLFNDRFMNMIYEEDRASVFAITREQTLLGTTVEFEYRVPCKDGRLMWVLDRGRLVTKADGTEFFFCMMMDITQRKEEEEKLRLALERHRIIMDQSTDIIFEWDIEADSLAFSPNWEKRFGYIPITKEISKNIPLSNNIHPQDMPCFLEIMNDIAAGKPYSEAEFRIRCVFGAYKWCRVRATTQFSSDHCAIKAVGVIVDIEAEKKRSEVLLEAAQRDALTQLYNKSTTKAKIEQIIDGTKGGMIHAMLIIDVDNFKSINDRFGHHCGDSVLSNMAKALRRLFRATDAGVVGRIGGDEFLVFIENVSGREFAAAKAKEIVRIFGDMPMEIGGELSCSVGVSFYPADGKDYISLYRCADKALYKVKHNGKVDFAFYEKDLCEDVSYSPLRTMINEKIDSENDVVNQELVQQIFQMLYHAVDVNIAIHHILQTIGRAYEVSRVYIFEFSEDSRFCSNTFEWCNEGVTPEIDTLQNLSFEHDLVGFFDMYDENGLFYCQDIQMLNPHLRSVLDQQGVVSVLQCFIKDGSAVKGFVGFDECVKNRYWTKKQINTLSLTANILSTFLIKQRLNEQVAGLKAETG